MQERDWAIESCSSRAMVAALPSRSTVADVPDADPAPACGELFNQGIHQLLLIMAKMTPCGRVASKIPYCVCESASRHSGLCRDRQRVIRRAGRAGSLIITSHIWLAGKLLMILFIIMSYTRNSISRSRVKFCKPLSQVTGVHTAGRGNANGG